MNSTVIEAVEGERIRIYVTNRLPVGTSIHWHGIYLPNGMDGVGADAAVHQGRRDRQVRVDPAPVRELHVPLPSTR